MYVLKFRKYPDSDYETYKTGYATLNEAEVDKALIENSGFWMVGDVEVSDLHETIIIEYQIQPGVI